MWQQTDPLVSSLGALRQVVSSSVAAAGFVRKQTRKPKQIGQGIMRSIGGTIKRGIKKITAVVVLSADLQVLSPSNLVPTSIYYQG